MLLATGGAGQVYRETTNPPVATGDGVAMAYRAGARVADLEFVQFHPTALDVPGQPRFLLSEALRGEGARLVNADGEPFMTRYDPAGDLAPRDRVAARASSAKRRGPARRCSCRSSTSTPEYVHARFPLIAEACRQAGLDLARDRIPVGPAAHYMMGGVQTDLDGRTTSAGPLRRRRGGVHGRPRREPAREQLAARGAGVRRAGGPGDAARRFASGSQRPAASRRLGDAATPASLPESRATMTSRP